MKLYRIISQFENKGDIENERIIDFRPMDESYMTINDMRLVKDEGYAYIERAPEDGDLPNMVSHIKSGGDITYLILDVENEYGIEYLLETGEWQGLIRKVIKKIKIDKYIKLI